MTQYVLRNSLEDDIEWCDSYKHAKKLLTQYHDHHVVAINGDYNYFYTLTYNPETKKYKRKRN